MTVYVEELEGGRKRYRVDVTWTHADGRVERIKRVSPIQTRRGAEQFERDIRNALADGTWGKRRVDETPTLDDFRERYFDQHVAGLKASTRDGHKAIWEQHLLPALGRKRLTAITTEEVQKLAKALREKELSPKTINNVLSCLRKALDVAADWDVIKRSDVPHFTWAKAVEQAFDFFSFEELEAVLDACRDDMPWGPMITFAAHTGMRHGELRALRRRDVDRRHRIVHVQRSVWDDIEAGTKTGKARQIPLNAIAEEALDRMPKAKSEYVFTTIGGLLTKGECKWPLWRACDLAGVGRRVGWHVLRHTFASHLVMRGASLPAVQALMGHATITMTMRYAHLAPDHLRAAVDSLVQARPQTPERPHSGHDS